MKITVGNIVVKLKRLGLNYFHAWGKCKSQKFAFIVRPFVCVLEKPVLMHPVFIPDQTCIKLDTKLKQISITFKISV